jgi:hypothetical protein
MRMEIGAEAVRALAAVGTVCGGTAVLGTVSEWTMALLGVPLIVVLAAVAGIALVVSYQPHQAALRLWTTIVASVFVACSAATFAIAYGGWPNGAAAFTAAAAGVLLQVVVPWLIERGPGAPRQARVAIVQARLGGGRGRQQ